MTIQDSTISGEASGSAIEIKKLEEKIKNTSNAYKIKSLKEKISWLKAEDKGNFINKDHLKEYKGLIIFLIRKCLYKSANNRANLAKTMQKMLEEVNEGNVVYRTNRGIKGIVARLAKSTALKVSEEVLMKDYDTNDWFYKRGNALRVREDFDLFKLDVLA